MAQLNDLVVTGSSRFLNKINGTCTDGSAGTTKYMRQDGTWQVPPNSGGTVTSITLKATSPIAIDSASAITTSGTRTLSHANSGVTAGTYQSVTVNATGHVTAGTALTKAQVTTALGYTPPTSDTNYYHTTGSWSGLTYTATANGGAGALAFTIPTGTSASTVAVGNHTHSYAGSSSVGGDATRALKLKDKTNNNDTYLDYGSSAVTWSNITYIGAWDGYTLRAMNKNQITPANIGAAAASHNQSADTITTGYLNIQPENSPILIPFMNNDLAFMLHRGGSISVKYDGTEQSLDMSGVFDGAPGYGYSVNPSNYTTITMELTLHQKFTWTNTIYVDFGSAGWRAKTVKIEVINTNYAEDVWTQKYYTESNSIGHVYVTTSHTPVGASNAGGGFNKIRFTFSAFNNTSSFRIAQLGLYNYGSSGLRTTYMSRGIDDAVWRNITPATTNTYNLGSSSLKWATVYATTFNGALTGNVTGNCSGSSGSCTGNAATATTAGNVTGTVAIANGGTGATTRLNALKALTNEDVGANATYFLTITNSWGKGGYSSVANVKTVLGLGSAAYKDASGSWGISVTGSSASCTGNAATASVASKSTITETNPSSVKTYAIPFVAGDGNQAILGNDGLRYYTIEGTTSAAGWGELILGNNTPTGTAGNKSGWLKLFSEKKGQAELAYTASATGNTIHYLPTTGGTLLNTGTTSFTQTLTSGTKVGSIKINGTSTDIFAPGGMTNVIYGTASTSKSITITSTNALVIVTSVINGTGAAIGLIINDSLKCAELAGPTGTTSSAPTINYSTKTVTMRGVGTNSFAYIIFEF